MTQTQHSELAKYLVEGGRNALHIACALGHWDVFEFILDRCSHTGMKANYLLARSAFHLRQFENLQKTITSQLKFKSRPIGFAILHNKGEFVAKLMRNVRVLEKAPTYIALTRSNGKQKDDWIIEISPPELGYWIECCAIFGAYDAINPIVGNFTREIETLFVKGKSVNTKNIFKWAFIHGQLMITPLEKFISQTTEIEESLVNFGEGQIRILFGNSEVLNAYEYFLMELRRLFSEREKKIANDLFMMKRLCFIADIFYRAGFSSFPFEEHSLIVHDVETAKYIREMNCLFISS